MKIALYQGTSIVSLAIRLITRSKYSHAAFLFDEPATRAAARLRESGVSLGRLHLWEPGSVVEAWEGGVRNSTSISSLHKAETRVDIFETVTPLGDFAEEELVKFCAEIIGEPYSYWNVFKFLTKCPGNLDGSWFCSEAIFQGFHQRAAYALLKGKAAWEVPPDWLQMPTTLRKCESVVTR